MSDAPLATKMWSRDGFSIKSDRGLRKTAEIINGYQITVPATYTEEQVSDVQGVPRIGDSLPNLSDMRVKSRSFTRSSPILWIGIIRYEGTNVDPVGEPPDIEWTDTQSQEDIDEDWNGNATVTANKEPIEGIKMDIADTVLSVKRSFRSFNPYLTHQYRHSVNSDLFLDYPPGMARLVGYSAKQAYDENDNGYWEVSARVQFRFPYRTTPHRAWWARVRHEGYYERVGQRIVRAVDENKEETSRPVLLAQDGTRLFTDQAYWIEFQRYGYLPYNALGLV